MKKTRKFSIQKIKESIMKFYISNKPVDVRDWIRLAILTISIPVFIYSAGQLGYKLYTYIYEDWRNSIIVDLKPDNKKDPFVEVTGVVKKDEPYQIIYATDTNLNEFGRLPEYEKLWQRNNDMIGWITFPGFSRKPINYPIMYSGDNSFYVYRDFDKQDSYSGSIFLDGSNKPYYENPLELDYNYVIYGHAMKNKSMFGNITDYFKNEASWKNNKIYVDYMNTRLEYEVFSTFLIDPKYNYRQTRFSTNEEYQTYLNDMLKKSTHDFGVDIDINDRIITLSTCYQTTRRTAVIGKLVRQIIYVKDGVNPNALVTPVVLPTYIPMNEPSPTPRITPGVTIPGSSTTSSKSSTNSSSTYSSQSSITSSGSQTSISSSSISSSQISSEDPVSSDITSSSEETSSTESTVSIDNTSSVVESSTSTEVVP